VAKIFIRRLKRERGKKKNLEEPLAKSKKTGPSPLKGFGLGGGKGTRVRKKNKALGIKCMLKKIGGNSLRQNHMGNIAIDKRSIEGKKKVLQGNKG